MPDKDLYQLIEVDPKASPEEISKAYRKKASKCHPDVGGNQDDFKELVEAYDILMDEDRRKRYDEYGDTDAEQMHSALDLVTGTLNNVLLALMHHGGDPEKVDVVELIKKKLEDGMRSLEVQIRNNLERAIKLQRVAKRFRRKGDNFLAKITLHPVNNLECQVRNDKKQIEVTKQAWDIVNSHQYDFDKSSPADYFTNGRPQYSRSPWSP